MFQAQGAGGGARGVVRASGRGRVTYWRRDQKEGGKEEWLNREARGIYTA